MFSCGKSLALRFRSLVRWAKGVSGEAQSALFSRQAAWRPGAFVDKLCQRRSVHARCWGFFMVERGLGVYVPKARPTKFVVGGKGLRFLLLVHSVVPTRAVLASKTRTHGPVWIDDGKELLRH